MERLVAGGDQVVIRGDKVGAWQRER